MSQRRFESFLKFQLGVSNFQFKVSFLNFDVYDQSLEVRGVSTRKSIFQETCILCNFMASNPMRSLIIKRGQGGGGVEVRFRLLWHISILLFIAGEPHKLDRQKYVSMELSFHKLFKNTTFRHLGGIDKTLS